MAVVAKLRYQVGRFYQYLSRIDGAREAQVAMPEPRLAAEIESFLRTIDMPDEGGPWIP